MQAAAALCAGVMQRGGREGYNLSREVLLAIRQGNTDRVQHLVDGLVKAMRAQRLKAPLMDGRATSNHTPGANLWDLACATQKLARRKLGAHHKPFWDEVVHLVNMCGDSMSVKEVAVFSSAFAAGAPARLSGSVGELLLRRASGLAVRCNARDMTMIVNGLSKMDPPPAAGGKSTEKAAQVADLAVAVRRLPLDVDQPLQSSLLLNGFARMRHTADPVLFGHLFAGAHKSLHEWDVQAISLLCNAFGGMGRQARAHIPDNHWRDVVDRCVEVLPTADAQHLACLAHGLANVGADPVALANFYDALESLLCSRPRLSDYFSAQDLALVAHSLARQKRPEPASGSSASSETPGTAWPFEEFASRRLREFTAQGLALTMFSAVRLRRGGKPFFETLAAQLRQRGTSEIEAPGVAILCCAAAEALPLVGVAALVPLRQAQAALPRHASSFTPWQVMWTLRALASACEWVRAEVPGESLWHEQASAREALTALCMRLQILTLHNAGKRREALGIAHRVATAEHLPPDVAQDLEDLLLS